MKPRRVLTVLCSGGWMPGNLSEGWRRLGWAPEEFFYGSHMGKTWTPQGRADNERINRELLEKAKHMKAEGGLDLIFMVVYDDVLEIETAKALKSLGIPLVNYHVDLVGQWQRILRTGRYFDLVACAQKDHWEALRRSGIKPYYMPMAANPIRMTEKENRKIFDGVLYLGSPWDYRTQVLTALVRERIPLRIYGNGWKTSAAQAFNFQPWQKTLHDLRHYAFPFAWEEGLAVLRETLLRRIQRRMANVVPAHEIAPDSIKGSYAETDFMPLVKGAAVNLGFTHFRGAPGSRWEERQVRLRDFEIPMAGGFYLAQDCAQLRELFQAGVHVATWNKESDLIDKIRYYLIHPEERRKIAAAGQRHTQEHHTWQSRFQELLVELQIPH